MHCIARLYGVIVPLVSRMNSTHVERMKERDGRDDGRSSESAGNVIETYCCGNAVVVVAIAAGSKLLKS